MNKFRCFLFGHRYFLVQVLNRNTRKVGCRVCKRLWAMHDPTRSLVEWDAEIESLYAPDGPLQVLRETKTGEPL